jgi:hypothetical protein
MAAHSAKTSAVDSDLTPALADDKFPHAPVVLEIVRGRTEYPVRPVAGPRFFIGSGPNCDLCLGGGMPLLHSFIQVRGRHVWIEAVANEPPLRINGETATGEWLRNGDTLDIGPFQLRARLQAVGTISNSPVSGAHDADPMDENLESLSALELVDLLESDLALVEEFEQDQAAGAAALLGAVRRKQLEQPTEPATPQTLPMSVPEDDALFAQELERLCTELGAFAQELERRSLRLARREASCEAAADALAQAQDRLVLQIEAVSEKMATLHANEQRSVA